MEPPARSGFTGDKQWMTAHHIIRWHLMLLTYIDNHVFMIKPKPERCLRCRGGMDMDFDSKSNDVPYLTKINFMWDGLPKIDFNETVMYPLNAGLASISLKNGYLLQH